MGNLKELDQQYLRQFFPCEMVHNKIDSFPQQSHYLPLTHYITHHSWFLIEVRA